MQSIPETTEVLTDGARPWKEVLREQGRSMTWLAQATGKTYPVVTSYSKGSMKPPAEWLAQVSQLLGETVS